MQYKKLIECELFEFIAKDSNCLTLLDMGWGAVIARIVKKVKFILVGKKSLDKNHNVCKKTKSQKGQN